MKKELIKITSTIVVAISFLTAIYAIGVLDGRKNQQYEMAQELCKYAEYDFCKVETYKIQIKKGK